MLGNPFSRLLNALGEKINPARQEDIEALKTEIQARPKGTAADPMVAQLNGSTVQIGGKNYAFDSPRTLYGSAAHRPTAALAHAFVPYCYYVAVGGAVAQTDGSTWTDA